MYQRVLIIASLAFVSVACSSGGEEGTANPQSIVAVSACVSTGDDSQEVPMAQSNNSGETLFTRSHTVGSPIYRIVTSRYLSNGNAVTIDYMVHTPMGTPKALVVLIAGGGLRAGIEGTGEGTPVTNSRGNYLVRSAHRFMQVGYLVITLDRPSDYISYGAIDTTSSLYDAYRNSMLHAVDIATVVQRENTGNLPVIIAGTSRGAVSAIANNQLAAGISISSAVTSGGGTPVGSASLPITKIERPVHILIHQNDACSRTTASASRNLFGQMQTAGLEVDGDEVTGGFRDDIRNDACGAFDYHGFNGIENCAVSKETTWMDQLVSGISQPSTSNINVNEGEVITLTAQNASQPRFAVPYATTSLGGSVSVNSNTGVVTYSAPSFTGTQDSFAFSVTDMNGGVAAGVVTIQLN